MVKISSRCDSGTILPACIFLDVADTNIEVRGSHFVFFKTYATEQYLNKKFSKTTIKISVNRRVDQ